MELAELVIIYFHYVLLSTYYTVTKKYKFNIFNRGKVSNEQSIISATVTGTTATLFIAVNVSRKTRIE